MSTNGDILSSPPPDDDLGLVGKPLLHADHTPASPTTTVADADPSAAANPNRDAGGDVPWMVVIAFCCFYFVFSGVENGLSPILFTTWQTSFNNASMTSITAAHTMTEVFKICGAPIVGHFANRAKPLAISLGAVVWCIGSFVISIAQNVAMLFVGFSIIGFGFSALTCLVPAVIAEIAPRFRVSQLLGIIYAQAPFGVALFFLLAGLVIVEDTPAGGSSNASSSGTGGNSTTGTSSASTSSAWRFMFGILAPGLTVIPLVLLGRSVLASVCGGGRKGLSDEARKLIEPDLPFWATMKKFATDKVVVFMLAAFTFQSGYITAMIALLSSYLEFITGSKTQASLVLAATVPAALLGTLLGGWVCKHFKFGLRATLRFCLVTNAVVVLPISIVFADPHMKMLPFGVVALLLPAAMFIVFLNAAPMVSCLAVLCKTKREVARLQSLMNVVSRSLGAVPIPLILSTLIDESTRYVPGSSLAYPHAFLIVGVAGASLTSIFCALALCYAPDVAASDGPAADDDDAQGGSAAGAAESSNRDGDMEMTVTTPTGGGGGVVFPSPPLHPLTSAAAGSSTGAGRLVMPQIQILEPSRSPDRGGADARAHIASDAERVAAEWRDAELLNPPINTFLSPEAHDDFL